MRFISVYFGRTRPATGLEPGTPCRKRTWGSTTLQEPEGHPVVNVTHEDAAAFAKWVGKRLPTQAEWEKRPRGGLQREPNLWGSEMFLQGKTVEMD